MCLLLFFLLSNQFSLTVQTVFTEISSIEALEGESANIPCDIIFVNGETNASLVLWYKEGSRHPLYSVDGREGDIFSAKPLVPDELQNRISFDLMNVPPILRIFTVSKSDAGSYSCRVDYRRSRTVYHRSKLTVIELPSSPVIKNKYGEVISGEAGPYKEGEPLALICESEGGNPLPKLRWFKGSEVIDSSDRIVQGGILKNELLLGSLMRSFNGDELYCEAKNTNLTQGIRTIIQLNVHMRPKRIQMEYVDVLIANEPHIMRCNTSGARPIVVITWLKDSQVLQEEEKSDDSGVLTSQLVFTPSSRDHGKQLTCRARNPSIEDSEVEDNQVLTVHYLPELSLTYDSRGPEISEINEGEDVLLNCYVSANPKIVSLSWMFNGTVFSQNPIPEKVENLTFTLKNVSHSSTGFYSCKAKNSIGEKHSKAVYIQVRYPPRCKGQVKVTHIFTNPYRYDITCEVLAYPTSVKFSWWTEKVLGNTRTPLDALNSNSMQSVLTVDRDFLLKFDRILCSAENISGKQRKPCSLRINPNAPPEKLENCSIFHSSIKEIFIRCNINGNIAIKQMYHMEVYNAQNRNLIANITSETPILNVTDVPSRTDLKIEVYNSNSRGRSNKTYMTYSMDNRMLIDEDKEDSLMDDKPIAAILTGMVAGIFMVLCTILTVIKLRTHCKRNKNDGDSTSISNRKADKSSSEEMCSSKDGQSPDLIPLHKSLVKDEKPIFIIDSEHSIKNDIDARHFSDANRYEDSVRKKSDGKENYIMITDISEESQMALTSGFNRGRGYTEPSERPAIHPVPAPSMNHSNHHIQSENIENIPEYSDCDLQCSYNLKCSSGVSSPNRRYKLESSV